MASARLVDADGPRWLRSAELGAAFGGVVLGALLTPGAGAYGVALMSAGIALLFGRGLLTLRSATRAVRVTFEVGAVRISGAGVRSQTIAARDVLGASFAPNAEGGTLAVKRRSSPGRAVVLAFGNEGDLAQARRALAVGRAGLGEISWPAGPHGSAVPVVRGVLAIAWLVTAGFFVAAPRDAVLQVAAWVATMTPLGLVVLALLVAFEPQPGRITLGARELTYRGMAGQWRVFPWHEVTDARLEGKTVQVTGGVPYSLEVDVLSEDEREHLAAHIRAAARRSRGDVPHATVVPSLAHLAPRGEPARAWLERIDAATLGVRAPVTAYRSDVVDEGDLWVALENPDAPTAVRAAAARMLARLHPDEARTRIARVLGANRDVRVRRCIVGALEEDIDEAARTLEGIVG